VGQTFSSYFIIIIQAGHMTKAHAIAYLPLIIASVLYTFRSKKWILGAVFTSLFVALQLYCNHYQITYYTIIILFFIGIVQFVKELQDKTLPNFFKKAGILVVAALLGGATNYTRLATTMEYGRKRV
jgi:type III secretory pathway component EscS